ncbi:MAG: hypothetical protein WEB06_20110 [Actinomycetota bacterium]
MDEPRDPAGEVVEQLADGLWRRLRDVILVAERIETYSFTESDAPRHEPLGSAEAVAVATDQVVRALREAGDPDGWRLLARVADTQEGVPLDELAAMLDRPRLATVERVNALVQAGLAQRALDLDRVFATMAGDALIGLVRAVASRLGDQAALFRPEARAAQGGGSGDGLPLL